MEQYPDPKHADYTVLKIQRFSSLRDVHTHIGVTQLLRELQANA